jgi:hypothetical protein
MCWVVTSPCNGHYCDMCQAGEDAVIPRCRVSQQHQPTGMLHAVLMELGLLGNPLASTAPPLMHHGLTSADKGPSMQSSPAHGCSRGAALAPSAHQSNAAGLSVTSAGPSAPLLM